MHGGLNVLASRLFPLIGDPQKLMPVLHLVATYRQRAEIGRIKRGSPPHLYRNPYPGIFLFREKQAGCVSVREEILTQEMVVNYSLETHLLCGTD